MARRGGKSTTSVLSGALRSAIEAAIDANYVDRDSPRFHFVRRAQIDPRLLEDLSALRGERFTDLNTDTSERIVFERDSNAAVTVRMSFLGPFAVLTKTDSGRTSLVEMFDDAFARRLRDLLEAHGYKFVPRFVLESTTHLRLSSASASGESAIFHALFEDTEVLPWRG